MDWKGVDERLIRRGELLLSLEFLESYDRELKSMNRGKAERHRKVSKVYAAGAYDSSKIYRTLE